MHIPQSSGPAGGYHKNRGTAVQQLTRPHKTKHHHTTTSHHQTNIGHIRTRPEHWWHSPNKKSTLRTKPGPYLNVLGHHHYKTTRPKTSKDRFSAPGRQKQLQQQKTWVPLSHIIPHNTTQAGKIQADSFELCSRSSQKSRKHRRLLSSWPWFSRLHCFVDALCADRATTFHRAKQTPFFLQDFPEMYSE